MVVNHQQEPTPISQPAWTHTSEIELHYFASLREAVTHRPKGWRMIQGSQLWHLPSFRRMEPGCHGFCSRHFKPMTLDSDLGHHFQSVGFAHFCLFSGRQSSRRFARGWEQFGTGGSMRGMYFFLQLICVKPYSMFFVLLCLEGQSFDTFDW